MKVDALPDILPDAAPRSANRPVAIWLFCMAGLLVAIVLVGGATRLTDSGLSITEWQPVTGVLPPLSEAAWQTEFGKYQQIPEYRQVNRGMSLAEFKQIYWWEWGHRLLGRLIGVAFLVPFVWFWFTGRLERRLVPRLGLMFVLGGLQGLLGWYMVMSGLANRVDVSQYRLAAHLGLAVAIYGYILWVAFDLWWVREPAPPDAPFAGAVILAGLVFVQILMGALVAGLDAGLAYSTWPKMDGQWIPDGLLAGSPLWANLFENRLTVQFDHRLMAYLLIAFAFWHWVKAGNAHPSAALVLAALAVQTGLGIWTLLAVVPLPLGLAHQGMALVVFTAALYHAHRLRR